MDGNIEKIPDIDTVNQNMLGVNLYQNEPYKTTIQRGDLMREIKEIGMYIENLKNKSPKTNIK